METTLSPSGAPRTARVSALGRLSAAALVGIALIIGYVTVAFGGFQPMPAVIVTICLIFAGLILTGWRWAPLLGLLPGVVLPVIFGTVLLGDPSASRFLPGLLLLACCVLAVIGGVAATVQNYLRPAIERPLPRWTALVVALIAGAVVGAEVLALWSRPAANAEVSPEMLAGLPALAGRNFAFSERELRVQAGEIVALRLENGDLQAHSFDIDELNVHAPMPVGQPGVAIFKPTAPGRYTFYCAPHYNQASGQGMHGTLIVEP